MIGGVPVIDRLDVNTRARVKAAETNDAQWLQVSVRAAGLKKPFFSEKKKQKTFY
jgi:hypothetical protein